MTAVLSPDCAAGKCTACPGDGWDADQDAVAPCPCACHHVTHSVKTWESYSWRCKTCGEGGNDYETKEWAQDDVNQHLGIEHGIKP